MADFKPLVARNGTVVTGFNWDILNNDKQIYHADIIAWYKDTLSLLDSGSIAQINAALSAPAISIDSYTNSDMCGENLFYLDLPNGVQINVGYYMDYYWHAYNDTAVARNDNGYPVLWIGAFDYGIYFAALPND
jgi:hypothetical protein